MAATNFTPISLYYSTTASAVPVNTNLINGELAINITDGKLYYKNNSGVVTLLAQAPSGGGTFAAPVVIEGTTTSAALRITQLGTGNALLVEDSTNPDSTPFVIDASGNVVIGTTTPSTTTYPLYVESTTGIFTSCGSNVAATSPAIATSRRRTGGASVNSGDSLGKFSSFGWDGASFIEASRIESTVDGTPGTNDMPGRLVFSTTADGASTPTERMRIDNQGRVGIGSSSLTGYQLRVSLNATGSVSTYPVYANPAVQSDVTTQCNVFSTFPSVQDVAFTLPNLRHFQATQGTKGASATVTNQIGFEAASSLTGATNNYGFYGNLASASNVWNLYMNGTAANYMAGKTRVGTSATPTVSLEIGATDAMLLPKGTTAEQPTGVAGYLRFNTTTNQFEGHNGTAWSSVGGAAIVNDTSTTSNLYPLFAGATSGTALTIYTGNANLLYKPSTGELQSRVPVAGNGIVVNSLTVTTSYTIAAGFSGASAGPITLASGVVVTVAGGSRWVIS